MPLRGRTRNVALFPVGAKDLDPKETFVPASIELANGRMSDVGHWRKRPGYEQEYDLERGGGVGALIPEGDGYAVLENGELWRLGDTPRKLSGMLDPCGTRPRWVNTDGKIVVIAGGRPQVINGDKGFELLAPAAPRGQFIDTIDDFTLIAGGTDTQFNWSSAGSTTDFPESNFTNVQGDGERIRHMEVFGRNIYFFKDRSVEIWSNTGALAQFARREFIEQGTVAGNSVVQANNTFYFFGSEGDFYVLNGITPVIISDNYRRELDKLNGRTDCYGIDFRKENVIRWFFPSDGRVFVYDYLKQVFSEDYAWRHGSRQFLPILSYMEKDNDGFIGHSDLPIVSKWDESIKTDDGEEIRVERRYLIQLTPTGNNAVINRIQFRVKKNDGSVTSNDKFFFRWRTDGDPWSDIMELGLGGDGNKDPYIDVYPNDSGRELEIELLETDAVDFLVTHCNITSRDLGK